MAVTVSAVGATDHAVDRLNNPESGSGVRHQAAPGAEKLSFGGSLRSRFEDLRDYNAKGYGSDTRDGFLLGRLRLHLDYEVAESLHAFFELQHADVWDSEFDIEDFGGKSPDENPFDVHQLFVEGKRIDDTPWGFKIGRQSIRYGDNRIWGPGEWGNVGSYLWDAAKVQYDTETVLLEALYGRRVKYESEWWDFDDEHFDFDAYGVYAEVKNLPSEFDLFFVEKRGVSPRVCGSGVSEEERRHTVGARIKGECPHNIDYAGTFAHQFGTWGSERIRAYGLHAGVGYTLAGSWKPRLAADFAYASGDSNSEDGRHETFDSVFGSRDRLYGRMNLFGWSNLEDYQLSFSTHPRKNVQVQLDYHYFRLAESEDCWYMSPSKGLRRDPTGTSGREVGQEIDFIFQYQVHSKLSVVGIVGLFFPGSFITHTGPDRDAQFTALQVTYEF